MDPDLMTDEELAERANVWVPADGGRGIAMSGAREEELRERLLVALERDWERDPFLSTHEHILDVAFAEIEAAGYAIVDAERLGRLMAAAEEYEIELSYRCGEHLNATRQCTSLLEPGDLEPIGGAS